MSQIDVLLMTDNSIDTIGGSEESTKIIINGLKHDYRLGVIQPGNITKPESLVHYFPISKETRLKTIFKNPFKFLSYILKVKKIINETNPRIIHTQSQVSFFIVSLLRKLRMIPQYIKFFHTERGLYIWYPTFFKNLFKFFMTELDVLITTTQLNLNYWKKALNSNAYESLNYRVIRNTAGKIFEEFDLNKRKKRDKIVVSFAGRLSEQKNWPLAVTIVEKLYKELGDNLEVLMAVGCLDEKSRIKTKDMFKKLNSKLGNNFKGMVNLNLEQMDEFYYRTDIFIITSLPNSESFGRTVIEAMSRKCVVLSTDAGGPTEIINNKKNIMNSPQEFVGRILELYKDKELFQRESNLGYENFKNNFSLESNIKAHYDLYKD